jgi:hypothetical protein
MALEIKTGPPNFILSVYEFRLRVAMSASGERRHQMLTCAHTVVFLRARAQTQKDDPMDFRVRFPRQLEEGQPRHAIVNQPVPGPMEAKASANIVVHRARRPRRAPIQA